MRNGVREGRKEDVLVRIAGAIKSSLVLEIRTHGVGINFSHFTQHSQRDNATRFGIFFQTLLR